MNLCLATYGERLSALLENAAELHFFQIKGRAATPKGFCPMPAGGSSGLLLTLHSFSIDTLLCGAAPPASLDVLRSGGIKVHPWLSGNIEDVVRAWIAGDLSRQRMPGALTPPDPTPPARKGK